ncbi:hypothetical protein GCM10025774_04880 [Microbacterium kyungheense]
MIAIVTALAVVLAAIVAGMVTLAIALVRWHADNRRLWLWNRQLVDHIYRGLPPPPPPPPAELFD